jgi:predicted transposase/invertase (TIGR01784 family)
MRERGSISAQHDRFFRKVFGDKKIGRDFCLHYLPSVILDQIELDTLSLESQSFVDDGLRERHSDLIYRVKLKEGREGYIYFLFEHKSEPDFRVGFYLLRYIVLKWDEYIKANPSFEYLPPIIPVVIYHGVRRWNVSSRFLDLLSSKVFRIYVPDFEYLLYDFSRSGREEIRGDITLRAVLSLMRQIFSLHSREELREVLGFTVKLKETVRGWEVIDIMLRYIIGAGRGVGMRDIIEVTDEIDKEVKVMANTIAEELIKQGIQQGLERGIQQGLKQGLIQEARDMVMEAINSRFDMTPDDIKAKIEKIEDHELLKSLHRHAIKASSLQEFRSIFAKIKDKA